MFKVFFPQKDSTISEFYPNSNFGIDSILEISKYYPDEVMLENEPRPGYYNSRILLQFDTNTIKKLIQSGKIGSNSKYYLSLYCVEAFALPYKYTLESYPVSGSWENGNGSILDHINSKTGVSWVYRDGLVGRNKWITGSLPTGVTSSYVYYQGGGTWLTTGSYFSTQSFNLENPDIFMDVTNIVRGWISGSYPDNGMILKFSSQDENSALPLGSLKFFSRETNTIFLPRLIAFWDLPDQQNNIPRISSLDYVVYAKNLKENYKNEEIHKVRIGVRPRFPEKTYSTSSAYMKDYTLPTSSYFSIKDISTGIKIIPYDEKGTRILKDQSGDYIYLDTDSLQPDRFYEFEIKVHDNDGTIKNLNSSMYFRISK